MTLMPPRKKNWTSGHYQLGVFVRYPDGSVFEVTLDKTDEALVQTVVGPIVKQVFLKDKVKDAEPEDQMSFTIVVNGEQKTVTKRVLSYEDVVRLAWNIHPEAKVPIMSVTYSSRRKPGSDVQREGILSPGKTVEIEAGMMFSAMDTSRA